MYALDPAVAGVADVSGAAANTLVSSIAPIDPGPTAAVGLGLGLTAAWRLPPDIVPSSASVAGRSVAPSDVTVNVTCLKKTRRQSNRPYEDLKKLTVVPAIALAARCAPLSSEVASGVCSCRARIARCDRCGRSLASTTPATCDPAAETSSSLLEFLGV